MVEALAAETPAYEPGTRHGYHALTYGWLVGEIVRRVSGMSLGDFVQAELAEPLDADGLYLGIPESERHRVAELSSIGVPRPSWRPLRNIDRTIGKHLGRVVSALPSPINTRRVVNALVPRGVEDVLWGSGMLDAEVPAANGFFTARSLARMYGALAGGGTVDGRRILSQETVDEIAEQHTTGFDLVLVAPHGLATRVPPRDGNPRAGAGLHSGHFGFGGSGGWADPRTRPRHGDGLQPTAAALPSATCG